MTTVDQILNGDAPACIESNGHRVAISRLLTGEGRGRLLWFMLNPSTADASNDDPTIRRCMGFTRDVGFSRFIGGNLFAWRSTDPKELVRRLQFMDIINDDDDENHYDRLYLNAALGIADMLDVDDRIVLAWGAPKSREISRRAQEVVERLLLRGHGHRLTALRLTRDGHPAHPLYLPASLRLFKVLEKPLFCTEYRCQ